MIKKAWEQILKKQEIRQNLSSIRQQIKEKSKKAELLELLEGNAGILVNLLSSEDAKTRKNAALLMGDLGKQEFLSPLFEVYQKEEQRFVRSAYLSAIGNFRYKEYLEQLKMRMEQLQTTEITVENEKHVREEIRELSALIVQAEGIKRHRFTGLYHAHDVILLTNRNVTQLVEEELLAEEPNAKTKVFGAGVQARVPNLKWIDWVRTYQELLFSVKGMGACEMEPSVAAEQIVQSDLLSWLTANHNEGGPFYFRVELKSKWALDVKSDFVKKLSGQIERMSNRQLINATADYEVELRIIENKSGQCNLLVKLFTLKDERFAYRKAFMPTSIKPVNAALTVALAKDYMKEGAQVLDPFCGVGTMLIERYKAVKANTTYGIDMQEEAILKAKENTERAGQIIHYINKDFFRFEHDYLFDEVITNMPFQIGRITEEEVYEIYGNFFGTIKKHLKEEALLVLYTHDRQLVRQFAQGNGFIVLKEHEISKREGTYVCLLFL